MENIIQNQNGTYVPVYGILITAGLIFSLLFMMYEWVKLGGITKIFGWLFFIGSFTGIVGSRWFYLILNPEDIIDALSFFQFGTGRSIIGALLGGWMGIAIFLKVYSLPIDYRMIMSIVLPNMLLGQAIGRWGNFYNQEVYGMIVSKESLDWLIPSIRDHMFIDGFYRAPLFLYESIANIIGWFLIAVVIKQTPVIQKKLKPGTHGAMYLIWYGITRSIMELYRDPEFIMMIGKIPTSFVMGILFVIIGILMIIYFQFYYWDVQFWKATTWNKKKDLIVFKSNVNMRFIFRRISYVQMKELKNVKRKEIHNEIMKSQANNKMLFEQSKKTDYYYLIGQK